MTLSWPDFKIFETDAYKKARFEGHNALFWMARCAHSFLEEQEDHKHMDLLYQPDSQNFKTKIFDGDLQIGLNLKTLELYFCENETKVPHSFWLDDRTPAYVEAWYLVELVHRDRDRTKFSTKLPFESSNMLMGDTIDHNASAFVEELDALHKCFHKTAGLLVQVSQLLLNGGYVAENANQIALKPETFSLFLNFSFDSMKESNVSVGLSAGDSLRPAPFFFTSIKPQKLRRTSHALDFEAKNLISLKSICDENMSDKLLVERLYENITASMN